MTESTWFWIGTAGMALGALGLTVVGHRRTQDEEAHTAIHGIVPLLAALSYFSMAIGQGGVHLSDGRTFWYARYIDWSVTTPLLLLGLSITALHGAHRRPGLVAALLGADALMIVTGLFSGLSIQFFPRWTWFVISCGAFLAVYAVLLGPLRREARARDAVRAHAYSHDMAVLAVLWLIYPIVVLLGPDGAGVWHPVTATACITVVDLLAKVAYGFLSNTGTKKVTDADLAHGDVSPALVSTHEVPSDTGQLPPRA